MAQIEVGREIEAAVSAGCRMTEYQIRILQGNGTVAAIITTERRLNDDVAIRSAKHIARGRKFEVWRGLVCIYESSSMLVPYDH